MCDLVQFPEFRCQDVTKTNSDSLKFSAAFANDLWGVCGWKSRLQTSLNDGSFLKKSAPGFWNSCVNFELTIHIPRSSFHGVQQTTPLSFKTAYVLFAFQANFFQVNLGLQVFNQQPPTRSVSFAKEFSNQSKSFSNVKILTSAWKTMDELLGSLVSTPILWWFKWVFFQPILRSRRCDIIFVDV